MKRFLWIVCCLALLAGLIVPAAAAGPAGAVEVQFYDEAAGRYGGRTQADRVVVTLNGSPMDLDVPGLIRSVDGVDGRTLVPVRPIAEALGATVLWIAENRQVLIFNSEDTIVLTLGSARAVVNGKQVQLPGGVPAGVVNMGGVERTMVPLRFVSEQLHAQVDWEGKTYTAAVSAILPEEPEPSPSPDPDASLDPILPPGAESTPDPGVAPEGYLLRIAADDNAQTLTLSLNTEPRYQVTDLGDRVVIDLLGFAIGDGRDGTMEPENPVVERVRYAQHGPGLYPEWNYTTRVVLDLAKGCSYEKNVKVLGDPNLQAVVVTVTPPETGAELPEIPEENWVPTAFTVCLDAGHGGSAPGAIYEEIKEKDLTLPITLRAAELLREKGYNVILTRDSDVYVDLYDRCDIANNAGADIFVSIHCNASSSNRSFQGTFTYSYPKSAKGEKLAGYIQDAVVDSCGSIDRGLLTNDYVVLRETSMPAALLETGFMSCHDELVKLADPAYQEKLAQGVAKGVEGYLSTLPAKGATVPEETQPLLPPR